MIRDWLRSSMGVFGCFGICVGLFCLAVWIMWQIMESMGPVKPGVGGIAIGPGRAGMVAEFRGAPPHDLGTAVLAMARGVEEDIEITLHLLDDWHRPTDQIVRVRMAPATARTLADRLWAVAGTAEIK